MGLLKAAEFMEYITDLHIHSHYAAATSKNMDLYHMAATAQEKGIKVISTGDFTHPSWFRELRENLEEKEQGLYGIKEKEFATRFVLGVEIATISQYNGKTRKVHQCVLAPDFDVASQINDYLSKYGDLSIDGRPSFNMSPAELVEIISSISKDAIIFPAHIWTPWYGILGSISGYDSFKEAYADQLSHIMAYETGLSADPPMCFRISWLDSFTVLSTSDAHSPQKIGREATVFELDSLSFDSMAKAIRKKNTKYTIEFYPEEGKYHYDGHRKCGVSMSPEEAKKYGNICPVCHKPLTLGVLHRVDLLADRPEGFVPNDAVPFVHAVPLVELISKALGKPEGSQANEALYRAFISRFSSEFNVLLKADIGQLGEVDKKVAKAIENVREGKVFVKPGYDGVFGIVEPFPRGQAAESAQKQRSILDF